MRNAQVDILVICKFEHVHAVRSVDQALHRMFVSSNGRRAQEQRNICEAAETQWYEDQREASEEGTRRDEESGKLRRDDAADAFRED